MPAALTSCPAPPQFSPAHRHLVSSMMCGSRTRSARGMPSCASCGAFCRAGHTGKVNHVSCLRTHQGAKERVPTIDTHLNIHELDAWQHYETHFQHMDDYLPCFAFMVLERQEPQVINAAVGVSVWQEARVAGGAATAMLQNMFCAPG